MRARYFLTSREASDLTSFEAALSGRDGGREEHGSVSHTLQAELQEAPDGHVNTEANGDGHGGKKLQPTFGDNSYHIMLPKRTKRPARMRWPLDAEHPMRAEWATKAPAFQVPQHLQTVL